MIINFSSAANDPQASGLTLAESPLPTLLDLVTFVQLIRSTDATQMLAGVIGLRKLLSLGALHCAHDVRVIETCCRTQSSNSRSAGLEHHSTNLELFDNG